MKLYNQTSIKCTNKRCQWEGFLPNYFDHKEECEKKIIFCSLLKYGCDWSGKQGEEKKHQQSCTFKPFDRFFEKMEKKIENIEEENRELKSKLEEAKKDIIILKERGIMEF